MSRKPPSVQRRRAEYRAQQRRQRLIRYGLAIVGAVVIIGLFLLIRQQTAPTVEDVVLPDSLADPPNVDGTAWGPVDAPVLIEEYSDFQ